MLNSFKVINELNKTKCTGVQTVECIFKDESKICQTT